LEEVKGYCIDGLICYVAFYSEFHYPMYY